LEEPGKALPMRLTGNALFPDNLLTVKRIKKVAKGQLPPLKEVA